VLTFRSAVSGLHYIGVTTLWMQLTMDKLRSGEASDPVPIPARPLMIVSRSGR
jgi:hypothetical protein